MSTPVNRQVNIYINQASAERALVSLQKQSDKLTATLTATEQAADQLDKDVTSLSEKKKAFTELSQEAEKLAFEIYQGKKAGKDMNAEITALGGRTKDMKLLTKEADNLKVAIEKGKKATADLALQQDQLAATKAKIDTLKNTIAGNLAPSFNLVKARVFELRRELEGMSADAPGYAAKFEEFEAVSAKFYAMQSEINAVGNALKNAQKKAETFLDKVKAIALGTIIGNTTQAIIEKVGGYFSGIISGNAKLSDSLADVRKSTGLTEEEVKKLNASLGKINTRTPTEELRRIAVGLGQIGEAATPEAIANIDKIVVALGDEFGGGAQEITTTLGILRNNLQDIKTGNYGQDVLHIGNALNVLGAEGLATAPVVVDFANRLSGIATTFGATSGQILGLSASLQELGVPAERGATAITRLLQKMTSETATYANVAKFAGISSQDFSKLINTDVVGALQKVAEGARKAGVDNLTFGKILKDLDADGSGAGEVLSKLANNADMLNSKINLSSKALKETGSITDEFNIKNNNMAAQLDKLNKEFNKLITSKPVTDFLTSLVAIAANLITVFKNLGEYVPALVKAFALLTVAWIAGNASLIAFRISLVGYQLLLIRNTVLLGALNVAQAAYAVVLLASNAAMALATRTAALFGVTLNATPIGYIVKGLTIAVALFEAFKDKADDATKAVKEHNAALELQTEVTNTALKQLQETITKENVYVALLKDRNVSEGTKVKALSDLIALAPDYLSGLSRENILTAEGTGLLDAYNTSLKKKLELQVAASLNQKEQNRLVELGVQQQQLEQAIKSGGGVKLSDFDTKQLDAAADKSGAPFLASAVLAIGKIGDRELKGKEGLEQLLEVVKKDITEQTNRSEAAQKIAAAAVEQDNAAAKAAMQKNITVLENNLKKLKAGTDAYINEQSKLASAQSALANLNGDNKPKPATKVNGYTSLEDSKKGKKDAEKSAKDAQDALDRMQAFKDKIAQLNADIDASGESHDALEIQRIKDKYVKLKKEYESFGKDLITAIDLNAMQAKEVQQKIDQQDQKKLKEDYQVKLQDNANYYNEKRIASKTAADQAQVDADEAASKAAIAQAYADKKVKDAIQNVQKFKVDAAKKAAADVLAAQRQQQKDEITLAEMKVIVAPKGSNQELSAQQALLKAKYDAEIANAQNTAADKSKIEAEYRRDSKQLESDFIKQTTSEYVGYAQAIMSGISTILSYASAADQAALDKDKAANDKKKANLQKRYDAGTISKTQYDKEVAALDEAYDKKQRELKLKEFRRNKAMALANAAIGVAQAVIVAFSAGPIAGQILAGITAAFGAVQIGLIAAQKPPEYAKGRRPVGKGGVPDGPSHADGGIKLVNPGGEIVGEMEGDEPILSVDTYNNNKEVVDQLLDSSMYGGGRRIEQPAYLYSMPRPLNADKVSDTIQYNQVYRNGGFAKADSTAASTAAAASGKQDLPIALILETLQKLNASIENGIDAHVSWNDIDKKNKQMALIKQTSSFNAIA